jgi:nucleotide-binding universal stress UspA family protein
MSIRILYCADGSSSAYAAGLVALQIAKAHPGGTVKALHVVPVIKASGNLLKDLPGRLGFEPAVVSPEVEADHVKQGEDILAAFTRDAELTGVTVETVIDHGSVAERVAFFARHVDLVVMGLRGTTEDRHPGQGGSHLDGILSGMLVPVLLVPRGQKHIAAFAIGYDGSDGAARALKAISVVGHGLGASVHAMYVSPDGTGGEVLAEVSSAFPDLSVTRHVLKDDEPHTAMARGAQQFGANVLAIGFRGRSKLKDFFYGTAADYIIMNTELMVLVAH